MHLTGLDECHFFLDIIELIEPGLDIFLLPKFFWGEFFSAMIAEKPHTQPDLSGKGQSYGIHGSLLFRHKKARC